MEIKSLPKIVKSINNLSLIFLQAFINSTLLPKLINNIFMIITPNHENI